MMASVRPRGPLGFCPINRLLVVALGVFFTALGPATARAADRTASPLATPVDPLGAELQNTFISAPADIASAIRGTFIAYRKSFSLADAPHAAALDLFADARYLVWLNGEPVHRGPNRFDVHGPEYDSVDLADKLHAGENTLVVLVMGNGGAITAVNDGMGLGHNARMMKHEPGLTLRLDVDGRTVLRTDDTWKWSDRTRYRPAKVDWANIVDRIDARVEDGDWTLPGYDDRGWRPAVRVDGSAWGPLVARRIPLLRDTPVEARFDDGIHLPVTLSAGQQLKFSTGRLVQAYTILELDADPGTHLTLDYAGVDYVARAGRQNYLSSDTRAFAGGAITVHYGRATILGLKLVERLYPFDRVGAFTSSDPQLNRIWDMCARSLEVLSEDAYVDCADRERAEWMDEDPPAFDLTRTAFAGPNPEGSPRYADARLLGDLLRRVALSVQPEGWVKAHTCSDRIDIHAKMEDRACDWVQGARRYLDSSGDTALIREIWPVIVRQMDWFLARRTPRGLVLAREWVVWGNPVGYVTCEGAGLNAFVFGALTDAAHLGRAIGDEATAERFEQAARDLADAFDRVLWDESAGNYTSAWYPDDVRARPENRDHQPKVPREGERLAPTMFSALWALDQGIVPEGKRDRVREYLLRHRGDAERVMTFYYLFKQLYAAGTPELDREVLDTLRTNWPNMADSPWQVSWEEFSGGSNAHIYGMFPGYFLSAYVLGVRPEMPASAHRLLIEPRLGDLTSAEGVVVTEFGLVPVSWRRGPAGLRFHVEVPDGTSATLRLPAPRAGGGLELNGRDAPVWSEGRCLVTVLPAGRYNGSVAAGSTSKSN